MQVTDVRRMTYLACPYSHPAAEYREAVFWMVTCVAARMVASGEIVFAPITYTHTLCQAAGLDPLDPQWYGFDVPFLLACQRLVVITLDGWQVSRGVQEELMIAEQMGIPIEFIDPPAFTV